MGNISFSYSNYSHSKPTPKVLYRDKLSTSSIGVEKPKYKLCIKNRDEWNTSFFLTTTTQNYTSIYPTYCSLENCHFEDIKQHLSDISYIYFSNNNDVRRHLSYGLYKEHIDSGKLMIVGKIKHSKFTELENMLRNVVGNTNNLQNYCTNHLDDIIGVEVPDKQAEMTRFVSKFL